jgi:hypothetical membrane protein
MTSSGRGAARWAVVSSALAPMLLIAGWLIADTVQPPDYSPIRDTISATAAEGAHDRWIMTAALVAIALCHLTTAAGLTGAGIPARIGLIVAGVAAFGLAGCPEPQLGSRPQHIAWTIVGALTMTFWPVLVAVDRRSVRMISDRRCAAAVTAVFVTLLIWMTVQTQGGALLGLAERVSTSVQTAWPFIVALALRRGVRHRSKHLTYASPQALHNSNYVPDSGVRWAHSVGVSPNDLITR